MNTKSPTQEQFRELLKNRKEGPFVMVNLLKFSSSEDGEGGSGMRAYQEYSEKVMPMLEKVGGRVLWMGNVEQTFIGAGDDDFDHVLLVEYPSRRAFVEMVSTPEYLEANERRVAGLKRTVLLVTDSIVD